MQKHKSEQMNEPSTGTDTNKSKREICTKCKRPTPSACICPSLPDQPLQPFKKCRVIVLQHPHETRRKNRSLPLIELCLGIDCDTESTCRASTSGGDESAMGDDFSLRTVIGRRLGEQTPQDIFKLIQKPNVLLLYPGEDSVTLTEGLELIGKRRQMSQEKMNSNSQNIESHDNDEKVQESNINNESGANNPYVQDDSNDNDNDKKVTLIFIDATWKYAKEMERKNTTLNLWPKDLIRVKLTPSSSPSSTNDNTQPNDGNGTADNKNHESDDALSKSTAKAQNPTTNREISETAQTKIPEGFKPRRFDIRTPPSENHLSTAECIAWVVSAVEKNGSIYENLMKPLDYMVKLWHSFDSNRAGSSSNEGEQKDNRSRKRQKLFQD